MDFVSPLSELGPLPMPTTYPYYNASDPTDPANFVSVVWVDSSGSWRVGAHTVFTAPYNWDREVAQAAANGLMVAMVSSDTGPRREDIPGTPEYAAKYGIPDQDGNYYFTDGSYGGNIRDSLAPGVPRPPAVEVVNPIDFDTAYGPAATMIPPVDIGFAPTIIQEGIDGFGRDRVYPIDFQPTATPGNPAPIFGGEDGTPFPTFGPDIGDPMDTTGVRVTPPGVGDSPIDDPSYPFPIGNGPLTYPPIDDPIPPIELPSAPPENSPTSENGTQMPPSMTTVPGDTPTLGVGITVSPWVLAGAAALLYFAFVKPRRR